MSDVVFVSLILGGVLEGGDDDDDDDDIDEDCEDGGDDIDDHDQIMTFIVVVEIRRMITMTTTSITASNKWHCVCSGNVRKSLGR